MLAVRYRASIFVVENNSNLDVTSSVLKSMMSLFTQIRGYHRIVYTRNDLYFEEEYFIVVHKIIISKTINMKIFFNEM